MYTDLRQVGSYTYYYHYQGWYLYILLSGGNSWDITSAPMAPSQPNWAWISVASDSSGMYLAAAQGGVDPDNYSGDIYTSSSGGSMWTLTSAPNSRWVSVASDSTGQNLAAAQGYNWQWYLRLYKLWK